MSVAGYFEEPRPVVPKKQEKEPRAEPEKLEYYKTVEYYDPVLLAHCRLEAADASRSKNH
jgi:hypothetical protein